MAKKNKMTCIKCLRPVKTSSTQFQITCENHITKYRAIHCDECGEALATYTFASRDYKESHFVSPRFVHCGKCDTITTHIYSESHDFNGNKLTITKSCECVCGSIRESSSHTYSKCVLLEYIDNRDYKATVELMYPLSEDDKKFLDEFSKQTSNEYVRFDVHLETWVDTWNGKIVAVPLFPFD